jgi:hypothetical protein
MKVKRRPVHSVPRGKPRSSPFEVLKRAEETARLRDLERIRRKEATPEEIQRENSPFTQAQMETFRIINLEQSLLRMR